MAFKIFIKWVSTISAETNIGSNPSWTLSTISLGIVKKVLNLSPSLEANYFLFSGVSWLFICLSRTFLSFLFIPEIASKFPCMIASISVSDNYEVN